MRNENVESTKLKNKFKLLFILTGVGLLITIIFVCLFFYWNSIEEEFALF